MFLSFNSLIYIRKQWLAMGKEVFQECDWVEIVDSLMKLGP